MKRTYGIIAAGVAVVVAALAAYTLWPRAATRVSGDPWQYRLTNEDLRADGWQILRQEVQTPADLAAIGALTSTLSLQNVELVYLARYLPPETGSDFVDLTQQVLLYDSPESAAAALANDNPGEGWTRQTGNTVAGADDSQVWSYTSPDPTIEQGLYRVDARVLNAVTSIVLLGTAEGVPDASRAMGYTALAVAKMRAEPVPTAIAPQPWGGQAPDLRPLLLTEDQLAQVDPDFGDRWQLNTNLLPSWTENSDFPPEAQAVFGRTGRLVGYQAYYVKSVSAAEEADVVGLLLFQQVTAYASTDGASQGLRSMIGIPTAPEQNPPPAVGDEARAWTATTQPEANRNAQAVTEINFRVGRYVASIQLTSRQVPANGDLVGVSGLNQALALQLARVLAANLVP